MNVDRHSVASEVAKSRQLSTYYVCLLAGFVVVTFGGQLLGEWVRSLSAQPVLDEATRASIESRSIITLVAYGLLAIYGMLMMRRISPGLSGRGRTMMYRGGLALIAIATIYLLVAYITTIGSM